MSTTLPASSRLYEFDLADPLDPEKWRVAGGSWGFNDGAHAVEDGGATADCWQLSLVGDELWATFVAWSVSHRKNWRSPATCPGTNASARSSVTASAGSPYTEIAPVVEYAVGKQCSLDLEHTGVGKDAYGFVFLAPATRPLHYGGVALEASDKGSRLVAYSTDGKAAGLTPYQGPAWSSGKPLRLKLRRDGYRITGWSGGVRIGPVAVADRPNGGSWTNRSDSSFTAGGAACTACATRC